MMFNLFNKLTANSQFKNYNMYKTKSFVIYIYLCDKQTDMKRLAFLLSLFTITTITYSQSTQTRGLDWDIKESAQNLVAKLLKKDSIGKIKTVAVFNFRNIDQSISTLGKFLAEDYATSLADADRAPIILERSNLDVVDKEHKLNLDKITDYEGAIGLGKYSVAQAVVAGTITELKDNEFRVNIKLLDTKTGALISSDKFTVTGSEYNKMYKEIFLKGKTPETGNSGITQPTLSTPITPTKQNDCETNKTCNICFINNTTSQVGYINIAIGENFIPYKETTSQTAEKFLSIKNGEKACIYDYKAGVVKSYYAYYGTGGFNSELRTSEFKGKPCETKEITIN